MDEQKEFDPDEDMEPHFYVENSGTILTLLKKKKYRCPKGHEWEGYEFSLQLSFGDGADCKCDTGLLCPYCISEFLRTNFPAEIVESEDEGDMVLV